MSEIHDLVDAPRIVEHGEKLDDLDLGIRPLRQTKTIFENPRPVGNAMGAVPRQGVVFEDLVDEGVEVENHRVRCNQPGTQIDFAKTTSAPLGRLNGVRDWAKKARPL